MIYRFIKSVLILWITTVCIVTHVNGQLKVIAHYNMGKSGNISFMLTPDSLKDLSGNSNNLKRTGSPVFFFFVSESSRLKGDGSVLFRGEASYLLEEGKVKRLQRFVLELTIRAEPVLEERDNKKNVLVYGDKSSGYRIVRMRDGWALIVDGETNYTITPL